MSTFFNPFLGNCNTYCDIYILVLRESSYGILKITPLSSLFVTRLCIVYVAWGNIYWIVSPITTLAMKYSITAATSLQGLNISEGDCLRLGTNHFPWTTLGTLTVCYRTLRLSYFLVHHIPWPKARGGNPKSNFYLFGHPSSIGLVNDFWTLLGSGWCRGREWNSYHMCGELYTVPPDRSPLESLFR